MSFVEGKLRKCGRRVTFASGGAFVAQIPRGAFIESNSDYILAQSEIPRNRSVSQILMSSNTEEGQETDLATRTRPKTQRPPMYKVLLLNDDFTPMEFVVYVLERLFSMTHAQSIEIMLTVHKKGIAVVGVFSHEVAETKVAQVMELARRQQHPLQCTMEKE